MASSQKISELTTAGPLTGAELVPIVQNGGTLQTTVSVVAAFAVVSLTPIVSALATQIEQVSAAVSVLGAQTSAALVSVNNTVSALQIQVDAVSVSVSQRVLRAGDTMTGPLIVDVNSTSDALRITQVGTGNALVVEDSANPDATPFVVNADGRVLVGLNSAIPVAGATAGFQTAAVAGFMDSLRYSADAFPPLLKFVKSRSATVGTNTAVQSGDQLGQVGFVGADGASYIFGAAITGEVDGTPGTNDMPGRLVFATTPDGASSPTERMRITNAGNVGIGTSAPAAPLDVARSDSSTTIGGSASVIKINNASGTLNATSGVEFFHGNNTSSNTARLAGVYGVYSSFNVAGLGGALAFATNTAGDATIDERMRIDASGNVGIGTTAPTALLNVVANSSSDAVRITQTGTGNALVVEDSANPDTTPFVIDATGRVLIGNTTTLAGVFGFNRGFQMTNAGGVQDNYFQNDRFSNAYTFTKSRGTLAAPQAVVVNGDDLGSMFFTGSDGTAFLAAAAIQAQVDGVPGTNDMPGRLVFSTTADGASTTTERMRIDNTGQVGVGGVPAAGRNFVVAKTITGSTTSRGITVIGQVQTDVTGVASYFASAAGTVNSTFTLSRLEHYIAIQGAFGASSTVTNQMGFYADPTLTGATNNFGFYSDIASGTGRWNFYANGTAANYFAGNVGIGTTTPLNRLDVSGSFGRGAPVTKTGNFTLATTENWIICNGAGTITVTFPAASLWTGREVMIKTIAAQTVVSASSNVVPLAGGAAGTAILAATAGAWATLVSDGTNWIIMQA